MKLIAHGGFSSKYPENTLEAFLAAEKFKPFAIEMDIILNPKTNQFHCYHPTGISSTTGTFNTDEISEQLDAITQYPLLSDVCNKLNKHQLINLDIKSPSEFTFQKIAELIKGNEDRYIVGMRKFEDFLFLKKLNPEIITNALFSEPDDFINYSSNGGMYFRLRESDLNEDIVARIHDKSLEVWVTPGSKATKDKPRTSGEIDEKGIQKLLDLNVDAVFVNDIEMAANYLKASK